MKVQSEPGRSPAATDADRLEAMERRALRAIQWIVCSGVLLLTIGAGTLSWAHLTK
ncbi:hypothetical protein [Lentzea waywayandensis]|uniref:hypothetical protein n=1 Tax=Lentzea waywayandensis TaxID=84724 RepID=UPI0015A71AB4|nr:hypothetical protein [Lentzea waywayandensis]